MRETPSFDTKFSFCSNFYACEVDYDGHRYKTAEHAFQAAKAVYEEERAYVAAASTPGEAKWRGRRVKIRPDWEEAKDEIMLAIVRSKFTDPVMRYDLINSRDWILCENNYWHDNYWGNCTCPRCESIEGENRLGKILMQVREEAINAVIEESKNEPRTEKTV